MKTWWKKLELTPWQQVKLAALLISSAVSAVTANAWYQIWQNDPAVSIPWAVFSVGVVLNIGWNFCNTLIAWSEKMEKKHEDETTTGKPPPGG